MVLCFRLMLFLPLTFPLAPLNMCHVLFHELSIIKLRIPLSFLFHGQKILNFLKFGVVDVNRSRVKVSIIVQFQTPCAGQDSYVMLFELTLCRIQFLKVHCFLTISDIEKRNTTEVCHGKPKQSVSLVKSRWHADVSDLRFTHDGIGADGESRVH